MKRSEQIARLIEKYDIAAKIGFGQNFLIDDEVIQRLEEAAFSFDNPNIVEIGCGLGALTFGLISRETKVVGFEIDRDMINVLKSEISSENFTLREEDFLKIDLKPLADNNSLLIGNLPYNLTKRILEKIISYPHPFSFGFMVQKEVADKLTYVPGRKTNSALGAYFYLEGTVTKVIDVSPTSFRPAPRINSTFITYAAQSTDPSAYGALKKLYMAENKTLINFLFNTYHLDREIVLKILSSPSKRIHEVNRDELLKLIRLLR